MLALVSICNIRLPATSTLFPYTTLFRSNSYGGSEEAADTSSDDQYFKHPGVAITVSSGVLEVLVVRGGVDRKSTRLNSSHRCISYAVFCLKKKSNKTTRALNGRMLSAHT